MTVQEAEQLVEETISKTKDLKMKRIAITGSVGKTTLREMITCIVSGSMKTIHTPGSANSTQVVSRTLLKADESTECAVMECGTGGSRGVISRCSRMIRPDVAIVTMIGTSHIGNFGSREAIFDAKIRILDGLKPTGTILLNMDDDLLRKANVGEHHAVMVSQSNPDADVYAEDIRTENGNTSFMACFRSSRESTRDNSSKENEGRASSAENSGGIDRVPVILHEMAAVNVKNALFAMKAAELAGIDHRTAAARLSGYRTSGIRQNLTQMNGAAVILDCYNASEESIRAALDFMDHLETGGGPGNLRIALIGDVLELGKYAVPIHQQIGDDLDASRVDLILLYGDYVAYIPPRIRKSHVAALRFSRNERGQLTEYLARTVHPGDLLLVKGSHGMDLEDVIKDAFSQLSNHSIHHASTPVESRSAFLRAAGRKAKELGLGRIRFTMPGGFSGTDRMSAEDCLKLLKAAVKAPEIHSLWENEENTILCERGGEMLRKKTTGTVFRMELPDRYTVLGGMTGSWSEGTMQRRNLCALIRDEQGRVFGCVIMGASSVEGRKAALLKLLDLSEMEMAFRERELSSEGGKIEGEPAAISDPVRNVPFTEAEACLSCLCGGQLSSGFATGERTAAEQRIGDDDFLYKKSADRPLCPASIEKLLTVLTALDYLKDPRQRVMIFPCDLQAGSGSKMFVEGDILTVKALITGTLSASSNTCAMALARAAGEEILREQETERLRKKHTADIRRS